MEIFKYKKVRIIVFLFFLISLLIVCISYYFISSKNQYGESLTISNLSDYINGKPSDSQTIERIENFLYKTVKYNVKKLEDNSIKDIIIRDDSFSQKHDKEHDVYTVNFIVDIKSLSQSYKVSYQWQTKNKTKFNPYIDQYGTQVICLPIDQLIFGDFNCRDERIFEIGFEKYDPVYLLLPYHVDSSYKIVDYTKFDDTVTLNVEAYAPRWVSKIDEALLATYTAQIKSWLKSRELNPDNYTINYIY